MGRVRVPADECNMGEFIDEGDVRRPLEFPRISERYRASAKVIWFTPSERRLIKGRPSAVSAQLLDLSVAGALLKAPQNSRLEIGSRVKFEMNGKSGVVEVRNIRVASDDASFYGISFFRLEDDLKAEIFDVVAAVRSDDYQTLWERAQ